MQIFQLYCEKLHYSFGREMSEKVLHKYVIFLVVTWKTSH